MRIFETNLVFFLLTIFSLSCQGADLVTVRSAGYSFQAPPNFVVQEINESTGAALLTTDHAYLNLSGGRYPKVQSAHSLINELAAMMQANVISRRETTVSGYPGIMAELEAKGRYGNLKARITVASLSPYQVFIFAGGAPSEIWDQSVLATYEAVLGSVKLAKLQ